MASNQPGVDGPRGCTVTDFDDALALINKVFRKGTDQDARTDYPLVYDSSVMHYQRILKVGGELVAHVPVAPRRVVSSDDGFTAAMISATVTHPNHRHRGYASQCLLDAIRVMDEEGWPVSVLWTLERTFPFYQNVGYEAVASQGWMYTLGSQDVDLFQRRTFVVVPYDTNDSKHLDAIMEMHEKETLRIGRSRMEYEALFTLPKISTFLAIDNGCVYGYLMYGESSNKPGLIEAGGSQQAVEALVAHVVGSVGRDLQAIVPLTPTVLGSILEARLSQTKQPVEQAAGVGNQMHRINSLEGLLRGIKGHLRTQSEGMRGQVSLQCIDSGESVTLEFADGEVEVSRGALAEKVMLTRRELTRLVFGNHPLDEALCLKGNGADLLRCVFPYYFPIWELDHC